MKNLDIRFKWRGKKYSAKEFSVSWWACITGGALTMIGGMIGWYLLLYAMCPNPM